MLVLLSFCSFPWWLAWLLPFLLGLLLGWALWAKWKSLYENQESDSSKYTAKISSLEADLSKWKSEKSSYTNKISKLENELRSASRRSSTTAKASSSFVAETQQPQGIDIKSLKADIDVLTEKRKELEKRVMDLTEERNEWRVKHEDMTSQYTKAKEALESSSTEPEAHFGDDWEAKYNHAVAETKRKEDLLSDKLSEIRRLKDRYSDVDRKITNAEREATEWKIKYNALKQGDKPALGLSALAAGAAATAAGAIHKEDTPSSAEPADTVAPKEDTTSASVESKESTEESSHHETKADITSPYRQQIDKESVDAKAMDTTSATEQRSSEEAPMVAKGSISDASEEVQKSIEGATGTSAIVTGITEQGANVLDSAIEIEEVQKPQEEETGSDADDASTTVPSMYDKIDTSNLQIIEGIGPKMESVLKENGIENLAAMAAKETTDMQAILDKYGDKYRIIDPSSWVEQAQYASSGKWDELITYQKQLNASAEAGKELTSDSKLEKYLVKIGAIKTWVKDDLKAIEGVGPAIEKILHDGGIHTWRALADTSSERIKTLLDEAGPRFKLADPTTWPRQAELAADGLFDELQVYQDELTAGRI